MENEYNLKLEEIGRLVKEIRLSKRMTQNTLASLCDIDIRSIQRIEKGQMNMSIKIFLKIAKSLEVSTSELLNEPYRSIF